MSDVVISGGFDWDRDEPRSRGSKFYCTPFSLVFTISKPMPPTMNNLFKRLGYTGVTHELGALFSKDLCSASDVLQTVEDFINKYLVNNTIDGQSPESHLTWELSSGFLWSVMYFKQSLQRYGIRPSV